MIQKTSFLLFLLIPLFLGAIEPLSFQKLTSYVDEKALSEWDGRDITIRGFIYKTEKGWVLSPEPQLRSCCHDKQPLNRLIFLGNDLAIADDLKIADITGFFSVYPVTDSQGIVRELLHIQNPKISSVAKTETFNLAAIVGCLAFLSFLGWLKFRTS